MSVDSKSSSKKKTEPAGERTQIRSCSCAHMQQDQMYGRGKRVFNRGKGKSGVYWRCSVCENEQNF